MAEDICFALQEKFHLLEFSRYSRSNGLSRPAPVGPPLQGTPAKDSPVLAILVVDGGQVSQLLEDLLPASRLKIATSTVSHFAGTRNL